MVYEGHDDDGHAMLVYDEYELRVWMGAAWGFGVLTGIIMGILLMGAFT